MWYNDNTEGDTNAFVMEVTIMSNYQKRKQEVREFAMDFWENANEYQYSWLEIEAWQDIFRRLGRRYGLLREFHENGIC